MALIPYFDGGSDFVFEGFSPDGLATFTRTGGITSLDHKCLDITVEDAAVIIAGSTKGEKVLQRGTGEKTETHEDGRAPNRCTSAALGTASQNTSILRSPRVVWRVTDCSRDRWVRERKSKKKFTMVFRGDDRGKEAGRSIDSSDQSIPNSLFA